MWIHDEIKKSLAKIHPDSIRQLSKIDQLPTEKAVQVAAYLWLNCCTTDNDIWYTSSRGLLWEIPNIWIADNIDAILDQMPIDWLDDFEYANLCATFCHVPEILQTLITKGKEQITAPEVLEYAEAYEEFLPEGNSDIYCKTMEMYAYHKKALLN